LVALQNPKAILLSLIIYFKTCSIQLTGKFECWYVVGKLINKDQLKSKSETMVFIQVDG
jgi:hypothetical protein